MKEIQDQDKNIIIRPKQTDIKQVSYPQPIHTDPTTNHPINDISLKDIHHPIIDIPQKVSISISPEIHSQTQTSNSKNIKSHAIKIDDPEFIEFIKDPIQMHDKSTQTNDHGFCEMVRGKVDSICELLHKKVKNEKVEKHNGNEIKGQKIENHEKIKDYKLKDIEISLKHHVKHDDLLQQVNQQDTSQQVSHSDPLNQSNNEIIKKHESKNNQNEIQNPIPVQSNVIVIPKPNKKTQQPLIPNKELNQNQEKDQTPNSISNPFSKLQNKFMGKKNQQGENQDTKNIPVLIKECMDNNNNNNKERDQGDVRGFMTTKKPKTLKSPFKKIKKMFCF